MQLSRVPLRAPRLLFHWISATTSSSDWPTIRSRRSPICGSLTCLSMRFPSWFRVSSCQWAGLSRRCVMCVRVVFPSSRRLVPVTQHGCHGSIMPWLVSSLSCTIVTQFLSVTSSPIGCNLQIPIERTTPAAISKRQQDCSAPAGHNLLHQPRPAADPGDQKQSTCMLLAAPVAQRPIL